MNNVWPGESSIFVCGTRLGTMWDMPTDDGKDRLSAFATVPYGTYNARPFRDRVLSITRSDRIVYADRRGTARGTLALPTYPARPWSSPICREISPGPTSDVVWWSTTRS